MIVSTESRTLKKCRPFLVLPMIETERAENRVLRMPIRNPGLNLFIKTWPQQKPKSKKNRKEDNARPLTATLDKPTILDVRLAGKIDMSKIRKEFLNISNICRIPLILKNSKTPKCRPLSLPPPENYKNKKRRKATDPNDGWEDEESSSIISATNLKNNKINAVITPKKIATLKSQDANNNNRNNNRTKTQRKSAVTGAKLSNVVSKCKTTNNKKSTKLMPEPCRACGRPDQPERFHSHPVTPLCGSPRKMEEFPKVPVKNTIQKPIGIKFKSQKNEKAPCHAKKAATSSKRSTPSPLANSELLSTSTSLPPHLKPVDSPHSRNGSGKRTLTCYLCGREFGTASLPLHEPKCLQKWERENSSLPSQLRRKLPPKPDTSVDREEWNQLAWEASQSTLTPCQNCGRTFYPDRLVVHQRSCKISQPNVRSSSSSANLNVPTSISTPSSPSSTRPPSYTCYICCKLFGSNSIKIHERQCLKKWNLENDSLPPDMRTPPPRPHVSDNSPSSQTQSIKEERKTRPRSARKPQILPCYICGRPFAITSVSIHEPQCLKFWKMENDKLPPNKRRPPPIKPDIKFTKSGKIDFEDTIEAIWQSHLNQLVPCKRCSRTFNPDRVEVHERTCKGY